MSLKIRNMLRTETLRRLVPNNPLEKISLFYVFLPSILFIMGWIKPVIALPVCLLLFTGLYLCSKPDNNISSENIKLKYTAKVIVPVLLLIIVVVFLSGIGGFNPRTTDAFKHNAFLKDLIEYSWPLGYDNLGPEKNSYMLATHIGYYLPAASVGKLLGWYAASYFLFLWSVLGVLLTVLWFFKIIGKISFWYAALFLFFGGLDIIGYTILHGWPEGAANLSNRIQLDTWMFSGSVQHFPWIIHSNFVILYCGPHHILPNWIIMLMILYKVVRKQSLRDILLLWAACLVGSLFFFMGMTPYILLSLWATKCRKLFSFQNMIIAPILLLLVGLFLLSNNGEVPHGWIWEYHNIFDIWPAWLLFCGLEFGLYAAFCPGNKRAEQTVLPRYWFWTAILSLIFFTMYRLGRHCEFTSKGSLPSLVVFIACLIGTIEFAETARERVYAHFLKILLAVGVTVGMFTVSKAFHSELRIVPPSKNTIQHFDYYVMKRWNSGGRQFLASPNDSFFWKYMAAEVETDNSADLVEENR